LETGVRGSRWLAPDVALVAAAVTLFYCLFFFQGYRQLFRDSDAGWHIRNGESILATGKLPHSDPFPFSRPNQPWFAWEWGADALTGAIHQSAGLRGVALFYGALIAAAVWLWFRLHWAVGGDFLAACAMAPLLLSTASLHWMARPHIIGWLFLLAVVWYAETGRRALFWVAILAALWANLHASFFLAPVILVMYRKPTAAAVAAAATFANPYGWNLHRHVFGYLTDSELLSRIGEFQSFDFHTAGSWQIVATVILGIAGGVLAFTNRRWDRFALSMLFSAMALRSARGLPLVALLLLPIANAGITRELPVAWRKYAERLRALDSCMRGFALTPLLLLAAWMLLRYVPAGFPPDQFPIAAFPHIPADARLFAPDKYGGYLIYRGRQVFFDGRSDFYGAEFLNQYGRIVQVRPGWRELWDPWRFTHALLPTDAPLRGALESAGWKALYADATAVLLERPPR
jgi:hypothetical protein